MLLYRNHLAVPKPPFLFGLLAVSFIVIHCYSKRKPARPVASIIRLNTWEVNNSEGKMFLVMECGEHDLAISMRNNRRPDGSLPDAQIASNWCQMLAGVHAIHQVLSHFISFQGVDVSLVYLNATTPQYLPFLPSYIHTSAKSSTGI